VADLKDLAQHYLRAEIPKSRIVLNSMDLFNVDGVDISMIALKTAFKSITTELKKILTELRFGLQIPDNWKPLVDEKPGNEEPTFSGVKVDSKALISYLFGNPDLGALFLSFYYFPSFSFFFPSFFLPFSFFFPSFFSFSSYSFFLNSAVALQKIQRKNISIPPRNNGKREPCKITWKNQRDITCY